MSTPNELSMNIVIRAPGSNEVVSDVTINLQKMKVEVNETTAALKRKTKAQTADTDAVKLSNEEIARQEKLLRGNRDAKTQNTAATDKDSEAETANTKAKKAKNAETAREIELDKILFSIQEGLIKQNLMGQQNLMAAESGYSKFYLQASRVASLGTPAVLKAGTWSALLLGGAAYEGIKKYAEFNKLITQTITQAGRSPSELPFLSKTALDIARQTGANVNDVANMMYRAASGTASWNDGLGATKKQLADVTKQVANLNVLGNIPGGVASEQSARVVTALVNANIRGVGSGSAGVSRAAYLINAAVGAGDIRQSELVSALGRGVLTSAKANGMSAQDAVSWIDLLTSLGTTGSVAGTYVKSGINLLTNPSTQGAKAMAMLHIAPGDFQKIMSGNQNYTGQDGIVYTGLMGVTMKLKEAMGTFNPFSNFPKYKGAQGFQGAVNLLETWGVNQIPKNMIDAWKSGKNFTQSMAMQAESLLLTKAFGGSKQFATIASLINNPDKLAGIIAAIDRQNNSASYNRSVQIALNTPSAQFHKMLQRFNADLISVGKNLTGPAILVGKVFTGLFDILTQFKIILYPLVGAMVSFIALATVAKTAQILRGGYALMGGGFARTSSFWGSMIARNPERYAEGTFRGRMVRSLGSGGAAMQSTAKIQEDEFIGKMGATFNKFGLSTDAFGADIERLTAFLGGEAMAGTAGAAGMAGRSAAEISAAERGLLSSGNLITKKAIREAYYPGMPARGRAQTALVNQTYEKLRPMQQEQLRTMGATPVVPVATRPGVRPPSGEPAGVTGAAAREGEQLAVRETGALEGGFSGIGGRLLGFLGGPVGMMAMMSLPFALPLLGKLGGLFSGGGGTPYTLPGAVKGFSASEANANLAGLNKKQQASFNKFVNDMVAGKDINKDIKAMQKLGIASSYWQGLLGQSLGEKGIKTGVKDYNALLKIQKIQSLASSIDAVGVNGKKFLKQQVMGNKALWNSLSNDQRQAYKKLFNSDSKPQDWEKLTQTALTGEADILNTQFGKKLGQYAPNFVADVATRAQTSLVKNIRGIKGTSAAAVTAEYIGSARLQATANQDYKTALTFKPGSKLYNEYMDLYQKLTASAAKERAQAANDQKELGLSGKTIQDLANKIAAANKSVYQQAGFATAAQFATAMVSSLKTGGPLLAQIVNDANKNKNSRCN